MNRFFRSLDRAFDAIIGPGDVSGPTRLRAIRAVATGGVLYLLYRTPSGEWRSPIIFVAVLGFSTVWALVNELRKLSMRVERLESEARTCQALDAPPTEPLFSN
jgi:hypothetical protein